MDVSIKGKPQYHKLNTFIGFVAPNEDYILQGKKNPGVFRALELCLSKTVSQFIDTDSPTGLLTDTQRSSLLLVGLLHSYSQHSQKNKV